MRINLNLGDTQHIIAVARRHNLLRNQLAYTLATAYWETARSMKPVREMGGEKYLRRKRYYPYVGMGYVQLTWKRNYQFASQKLGVDFVKNPRKLLVREHASEILVLGMKEGWFTGKKLADYVTLWRSNFKGARRIINGTDRASKIAAIARDYDKALKAAGYGVKKAPVPKAPKVAKATPAAPEAQETTTGWLSSLISLLPSRKANNHA